MAESSKTLDAGAAYNINGTTNINLYQMVWNTKRDQMVSKSTNGSCRKGLGSQSFLACSKYGVEWGVGP